MGRDMDFLEEYGGNESAEYSQIRKLYKHYPEFFTLDFQEFGKLKRVGSGGFGTVYKSVYRGDLVAVKRIYADTRKVYKYLVREISNLRTLDHPNILRYIGVCHRNYRELYLVTDFVDGGSLESKAALKKLKNNYQLVVDVAIYVARGMAYMEHIGMLHRDLKLSNILVSHDMQVVKLCDFGLSRKVTNDPDPASPKVPTLQRKMTMVGTSQYMAPEMDSGDNCGTALDVYSYGVVLSELLGCPVKRKGRFDKAYFDKKRDKRAPQELVALVLSCTKPDPSRRPTFKNIVHGLEGLRKDFFPEAIALIPDTYRAYDTSQPTTTAAQNSQLRNSSSSKTEPVLRRTRSMSTGNEDELFDFKDKQTTKESPNTEEKKGIGRRRAKAIAVPMEV